MGQSIGNEKGLLDKTPESSRRSRRGESFFKTGMVVGLPTYGMVDDEFMENMMRMTAPVNLSPYFYRVRGKEVGKACNEIVEYALKVDANYVYFREDDVLTPPGTLERMMTLDVDIVSALCMAKQKPPFPVIFKSYGGGPWTDWYDEVGKPFKVLGVGMGAMLIKIDVFKNLEKPWFKSIHLTTKIDDRRVSRMTQDLYFCMKAIGAGYDVWCDTGSCCGHKDVYTGDVFFFDVPTKRPAWVEAKTGKMRYGITAKEREEKEGVKDLPSEVVSNVKELFLKGIITENYPSANWELISKELSKDIEDSSESPSKTSSESPSKTSSESPSEVDDLPSRQILADEMLSKHPQPDVSKVSFRGESGHAIDLRRDNIERALVEEVRTDTVSWTQRRQERLEGLKRSEAENE